MYYPVFLDLRGREVLVVGAGKVALRKVKGLLEAGAKVTVVSPHAEPEFAGLAVDWKVRSFDWDDIQDQALIYTATDDRTVNRAVAEAATAKGIWVNVADAPEECSFLVPSRITRGNLQVAVSTSGRDPKVAISIRKGIEALLDNADQGLSR
jgi:precorrin-2 dehydrogenase / sirohydrochlorin ferrochelatase